MYVPKDVLASGFTSRLDTPLNMQFLPLAPPGSPRSAHRLFTVVKSQIFLAQGKLYKCKPSLDQNYRIERDIIGLVRSLRCLVNSFTCLLFIMAGYNTPNGHRAILEARLSAALESRSIIH